MRQLEVEGKMALFLFPSPTLRTFFFSLISFSFLHAAKDGEFCFSFSCLSHRMQIRVH